MYVKYVASLALLFFARLTAYVFAPFIAAFADENGTLPAWLSWFNVEYGTLDEGWRVGTILLPLNTLDGTYSAPIGFSRYTYRVRWVWSHPAEGLAYGRLGVAFDPIEWSAAKTMYDYHVHANLFRISFAATNRDGTAFALYVGGWRLGWDAWSCWDDEALAWPAPGSAVPRLRIMFDMPNPSNWFKLKDQSV